MQHDVLYGYSRYGKNELFISLSFFHLPICCIRITSVGDYTAGVFERPWLQEPHCR